MAMVVRAAPNSMEGQQWLFQIKKLYFLKSKIYLCRCRRGKNLRFASPKTTCTPGCQALQSLYQPWFTLSIRLVREEFFLLASPMTRNSLLALRICFLSAGSGQDGAATQLHSFPRKFQPHYEKHHPKRRTACVFGSVGSMSEVRNYWRQSDRSRQVSFGLVSLTSPLGATEGI